MDQRHNIHTLGIGTFRTNATTNGQIRQNIVMLMRVRRVANILMMRRMQMQLVELTWKDVVGGDEEVSCNCLLPYITKYCNESHLL